MIQLFCFSISFRSNGHNSNILCLFILSFRILKCNTQNSQFSPKQSRPNPIIFAMAERNCTGCICTLTGWTWNFPCSTRRYYWSRQYFCRSFYCRIVSRVVSYRGSFIGSSRFCSCRYKSRSCTVYSFNKKHTETTERVYLLNKRISCVCLYYKMWVKSAPIFVFNSAGIVWPVTC